MGSSERDLRRLCQGAVVKAGLAIHGAETANSASKIAAWARESL